MTWFLAALVTLVVALVVLKRAEAREAAVSIAPGSGAPTDAPSNPMRVTPSDGSACATAPRFRRGPRPARFLRV
jgi:hypothetical protein